jgi:hypothetical protein
MIKQGKIERLRPEVVHFFDTNFVIRGEKDLPSMGNVPPASRWITETVRQEVFERSGMTAQGRIDTNYRTLEFNDLYAQDHRACPVFYFYVRSMYNPALVGSLSFVDDQYESMLIKGIATQADRDQYEKIRSKMVNEELKMADGIPALQRSLRLEARLRKKARRSFRDRHPAFIRDIKSLALALYYALSSRQNAVYYTADGDVPPLLLKWLDSMATEVTLRNLVLARLGRENSRLIQRDGKIEILLEYEEFVHAKQKLFRDFVNDQGKKKASRFSVKHWDVLQRKLSEDFYLWFEDGIAGCLSNLHGPMSCPYTANCELGNWMRLHYYWPPDKVHEGKLRVVASRKRIVNRVSGFITPSEHDRLCKYRRDDVSGQIQNWTGFI